MRKGRVCSENRMDADIGFMNAVERVLRSGMLSHGANVEAFESAFAD